MLDKKIDWIKVAESEAEISWQPNHLSIITAGSKTITLAKHQDQLFACAHKCPHAGGIMANGSIDALGNVVCPLHRYKFSLHNGRNTSGEGYYLKTYPVKVEAEGVFVGIPVTSFFNF